MSRELANEIIELKTRKEFDTFWNVRPPGGQFIRFNLAERLRERSFQGSDISAFSNFNLDKNITEDLDDNDSAEILKMKDNIKKQTEYLFSPIKSL